MNKGKNVHVVAKRERERERERESRGQRTWVIWTCKALCFALFFLLLLQPVELVLQEKRRGDNAYARTKRFFDEDQSPDVVFLGSSHVGCGIDPLVIYQEHGYAGYSLSPPSAIAMTYELYLKQALKAHKPKVIGIDIAGMVPSLGSQTDAATRTWFDPLPLSLEKLTAVNEVFERNEKYDLNIEYGSLLSYIFPLLRFHSRWKEITRADFSEDPPSIYSHSSSCYYHGYDLLYQARTVSFEDYSEEVTFDGEKMREVKEIFERIVQMCKESGTELFFFKVPTTYWRQSYHDYVSEWADAHGIPFLDCNEIVDEIGMDLDADFFDSAHLNAFGAEKVSHYMGQYLSEHYDLPDHRGDPAYADWDYDWQVYQQDKAAWLLSQETDWTSYLEKLRDPNYTVYIAVRDNIGGEKHPELTEQLKTLGLTPELDTAALAGYIGIMDGGEVVYEQLAEEPLTYEGEINGHHVRMTSEGSKASIQLDWLEKGLNRRGLNIVVYDDLLEDVVDRVTFDLWDGGKVYR